MEPDPQLVYEAQRIIKASNVHTVTKCLKWYQHWCHVGNMSAAEVSAHRLREEVQKAQHEETLQRRAQRA